MSTLLWGLAQVLITSGFARGALRARAIASLERRLGPVQLGDELELRWNGGVSIGPLSVLGPAGASAPLFTATRVVAWPKLWPLLRGELVPATVRLEGLLVRAGPRASHLIAFARERGARRGASGDTAAAASSAGAAEDGLPELELRGLLIRLGEELKSPTLGPLSGSLILRRSEAGDERRLRARLVAADGARLEAAIEQSYAGLYTGRVTLSDGAVPLVGAPVFVRGTASGSVHFELDTLAGRHSVWFRVGVSQVTLEHPMLAFGPVSPLALSAEGALTVDLAGRAATLERLRLRLGEAGLVAVDVVAKAALGGELDLQVSAADVDFEEALRALPAAFHPGGQAESVRGKLGLELSASGPLAAPSSWKVNGKLDLSRLSGTLEPDPLEGTFTHAVQTVFGKERRLTIGARSPTYASLADISPVLTRAVLVSEDSFFYRHRGFDFASLRRNLLDRADPDERLKGGSTLTQQLAKNLFLTRERTLARKVKEAFLTVALEARLPKQRLLEVYLNIIEWGPGLYGVGEAASHYFQKRPSELSVREAAFLASIIPNPVRFHGYCSRGALTETWNTRLAELLFKLHEAGDLDEDELDGALRETLVFRHPHPTALHD